MSYVQSELEKYYRKKSWNMDQCVHRCLKGHPAPCPPVVHEKRSWAFLWDAGWDGLHLIHSISTPVWWGRGKRPFTIPQLLQKGRTCLLPGTCNHEQNFSTGSSPHFFCILSQAAASAPLFDSKAVFISTRSCLDPYSERCAGSATSMGQCQNTTVFPTTFLWVLQFCCKEDLLPSYSPWTQ